jgi:hypothetical protein
MGTLIDDSNVLLGADILVTAHPTHGNSHFCVHKHCRLQKNSSVTYCPTRRGFYYSEGWDFPAVAQVSSPVIVHQFSILITFYKPFGCRLA